MSLHTRAREALLAALTPPPPTDHTSGPAPEAAALSAAAEPLVPGTLFADRYRMIASLGRGVTGEVWRADDLVVGTPVALKVIGSTGPEGRARILEEVRLARRITHPAVCRVFDIGESEGRVFYSMELIDGEDVATLLRRVGRLPPERVADIGQQSCDGLAEAHAQGVLHRALKPANILVDDEGAVRITDFGIAASNDDALAASSSGKRYLAPEQIVQGGAVSERSDLFSLGLVLYELLTGRPPFAAVPDRKGPTRPSALVPDVDPVLERAILQALSVDPSGRPASA